MSKSVEAFRALLILHTLRTRTRTYIPWRRSYDTIHSSTRSSHRRFVVADFRLLFVFCKNRLRLWGIFFRYEFSGMGNMFICLAPNCGIHIHVAWLIWASCTVWLVRHAYISPLNIPTLSLLGVRAHNLYFRDRDLQHSVYAVFMGDTMLSYFLYRIGSMCGTCNICMLALGVETIPIKLCRHWCLSWSHHVTTWSGM